MHQSFAAPGSKNFFENVIAMGAPNSLTDWTVIEYTSQDQPTIEKLGLVAELRARFRSPCYPKPTGSNFYARPIEGLYAVYDIGKREVLKVVDTGVVPIAEDS
jgi:Cu2+-containing amine oxidase